MQEHSDDTTRTTGRGYNRHTTDATNADTGVARDLYAPVPGDDDDTRPGMVGERTTTSSRVEPTTSTRTTEPAPTHHHTHDTDRTTYRTNAYTMRSRSDSGSDSGIMEKIQSNPLAVVAAATAGGLLLGRMMRNRNKPDSGYMRMARSDYGYQGYQPSYSYQQPSFRPYQQPTGYQGYQGQGFQQGGYQGYQPAAGTHGAPQYQPEQEFEGRHDNFRSGSHWD